MDTREKQNLLTMIIIVATLAIVLIIGLIIYPSIKENNQATFIESQTTKDTTQNITSSSKTTETTDTTQQTNTQPTVTSETKVTEETNNSIGKEEMNKIDDIQTKEEKAIELARKEWGKDDTSVTYNVEQKEENIYYIAVRENDQVKKWYEVDTEKWTIAEY